MNDINEPRSLEVEIPDYNKPWLEKKVLSLNKKLRRLGIPTITVLDKGQSMVQMADLLGSGAPKYGQARRSTMQLTYPPAIKVDKHEISGVISRVKEHEEGESKVAIKALGGHKLPPRYYSLLTEGEKAFDRCDHCQMKRRRIVNYLVLREGEEEPKLIGSSCLQDYIGGTNVESFIRLATLGEELKTAAKKAGRGEPLGDIIPEIGYPVERLLGAMLKTYHEEGLELLWAPDFTTKLGNGRSVPQTIWDRCESDEELTEWEEKARPYMDWARTDAAPAHLQRVANQTHNFQWQSSYALLLIPSARMESEKNHSRIIPHRPAPCKSLPCAGWYGEVGSHHWENLTVDSVSTIFKGRKKIVRFLTQTGKMLCGYYNITKKFKEGEKICAYFTVTKHDKFRGKKHTNIRVQEIRS